jgi:membrane protease YdiL (CAAX protease family)
MSPEILVALVLGGAAFAMGVPIALKVAGYEPSFIANLGFAAGPRGNVWAWGAAVMLAFAYTIFSVQHIPAVARHWNAVSWLKALAILAAIAAGILEEAVFRRLIMDGLAKVRANGVLQVVASALAFGIAHGTWGLLGGSLHAAIGAAIATTVLGAGLAVIYLLGGRSLAPCIFAHFVIDSVIEPGLLLSAIGGFQR